MRGGFRQWEGYSEAARWQMGREREDRSPFQHQQLLIATASCPGAFGRFNTKLDFDHIMEKPLTSSILSSLGQLTAAGMAFPQEKGHELIDSGTSPCTTSVLPMSDSFQLAWCCCGGTVVTPSLLFAPKLLTFCKVPSEPFCRLREILGWAGKQTETC